VRITPITETELVQALAALARRRGGDPAVVLTWEFGGLNGNIS